jgi:hypothetical protein
VVIRTGSRSGDFGSILRRAAADKEVPDPSTDPPHEKQNSRDKYPDLSAVNRPRLLDSEPVAKK